MTSRRRFLAGLGTAATGALAGCSALDLGGGGTEDYLEPEDFEDWAPESLVEPSALPFSLPETLFEAQRSRTADLLESVPADPAVPNGEIRSALLDKREHVASRIESGSDADTDRGRLQVLHRHRVDAAEVFGYYRAATGKDDAQVVEARRQQVRRDLADVEASIEYTASSPLDAVLAYEPVEDRLERARANIPPDTPYPDDPAANVELAGRAYADIESATAALAEARGIRTAADESREGGDSQWATLAEAVRWLGISVSRTRNRRVPIPESAEPESVFEIELAEPERDLYRYVRGDVEHGEDAMREANTDGRYATAVLRAGRTLAGIAGFDAVITAIRNDDLPDSTSVESVKDAASDAYEAIQGLTMAEYPFLTVAIAKPAIWEYESGVTSLQESRFDPGYAETSFRHAFVLAAAAPEAAAFVARGLRESGGNGD